MYCRNMIVCFVLVVVCFCVVSAKNVDVVHRSKRTTDVAEHNCDNVKPFFEMKNISLPPAGSGKGQLLARCYLCEKKILFWQELDIMALKTAESNDNR